MTVRFELTQRLAEFVGVEELSMELPDTATVGEAVSRLEGRVDGADGRILTEGHALHPSVLVVVDGEAHARGSDRPLTGGETIELILPVAGG